MLSTVTWHDISYFYKGYSECFLVPIEPEAI